MKKAPLYISGTLVSFSAGILVFFIIFIADSIITLSEIGLLLLSIPLNIILMLLLLSPIINLLSQLQAALSAINAKKTSPNIDDLPLNLLAELVEQANTLIGNQREFQAARGRLYEQISEVAAQEERKRLARDLHDSIKQQVFSISISAAAAQAHLDQNPTAAREALVDVKQSAQEAMVEMRALLQQLAPAPLEKSGLIEALREQAEALSYRTGATVETTFGALPHDDSFPIGTQEALFRMAQEALSNIARHARAKHVTLSLGIDTDRDDVAEEKQAVALHITDDGQGFDMTTVQRGMGISNIERRVAEINGATHTINSTVGNGTSLRISVPLYDVEADEVAQKEREARYKTLLTKTLNRYWGFVIGFSVTLFALSLVLRVIIQQSSWLLLAMAILALLIAIPTTLWFLRRFQQHRRIYQDATPPTHATRHFLKNRMNQGDWIAWFSLITFVVPLLFLLPDISFWLPTAIGLVGTFIMSVHLILVARERHRELLALHPVSYDNVMNDLRSSLLYGWVTTVLLILLFVMPNLLNVDVDPLLQMPIRNEDQLQRLTYFVMVVMFALYHAAISWIYWHHHQSKPKHMQTEKAIS